jgi:hypothetical protein
MQDLISGDYKRPLFVFAADSGSQLSRLAISAYPTYFYTQLLLMVKDLRFLQWQQGQLRTLVNGYHTEILLKGRSSKSTIWNQVSLAQILTLTLPNSVLASDFINLKPLQLFENKLIIW